MRVGLDSRAVRWIRVRAALIAIAIAAGFLVVACRSVQLQVVQREHLGRLARDQYVRELTLKPRRGIITDRNGAPLAENAEADSIFVDPEDLSERTAAGPAARRLALALGLDASQLTQRISRGG